MIVGSLKDRWNTFLCRVFGHSLDRSEVVGYRSDGETVWCCRICRRCDRRILDEWEEGER